MNGFWVLLLVQASSQAEAVKAVWEKVQPDINEPLSRPFLQQKGVWPIDVLVKSDAKVLWWANCFKTDDNPALLAHFKR